MTFREIFRFELAYRLRRPSTWVYAGILFLFTLWFMLAFGDEEKVWINAPERIAQFALLAVTFGLVVSAGLFSDAGIRDVQVGMDPLLFTSPLSKLDYLGGRFLAAVAVNALLLLAVPLAELVGTTFPFLREFVGPFQASAYVQTYLIFLLPNVVLIGAFLFTVAILTRKVIPVYLAALALFIGLIAALNVLETIQSAALAMLADPFGFGVLNRIPRYWTVAERNSRLLGFTPVLLWNRAIWLTVAAALLALVHNRFRFAHRAGGRDVRKSRRTIADPGPERVAPVTVPRVAGVFGRLTWVRQTLALARFSLAGFARSPASLLTFAGCAGMVLLFGWNVGSTVFETSTWPVTHLVADVVFAQRIVPIVLVLIAVYAGELVWKDRDAEVADIADAAPVSDGVMLMGRVLALVAVVTAFHVGFITGGVLLQSFQGYHHFEPGLYLRMVLGMQLSDYLLVAVLAMTVHVAVNHKYVGHILVLLAVILVKVAPEFGIRHHLLLYGTDPGWTYSDMNGFGPFVAPFVWFKLYWAAWAVLLLVLAQLLLVRGCEPGLRGRLRSARARFTGPVVRAAGVAVTLILALGGFIYYNTNVLNEYRTDAERGAPQGEYEKRYKRFENAPQPVIERAALRVEIYPDQPAADLSGTYLLVNRSGAPIDSVHVFTVQEIETRSIALDRPSTPEVVDDETNYRIYALERPLQPDDSLQLTFDVTFRPRGFPNDGIPTEVAENGTRFDRRWLPMIGYQALFELTDERERARFGLTPRPPMPGPEDAEARRHRFSPDDGDAVHVEAIIGTAADQIAVTPGVLRRSWTESGRSYFQYDHESAGFGFTVYSARYEVLADRWGAVDLEVYHEPAHGYVLDRTIRSMKASLDYFTQQFGPYPAAHLRLLEAPCYGGFGIAHPYMIGFTEDYFLSRVQAGEVDLPFYGTAHEIAHQWWGGEVRGAGGVRGHGLLTESLANYSAMAVTERTYGLEMGRQVYAFQMGRYLEGRAEQSREVPLLEVEEQPYIAYRKGAIAMYLLRDYIGEEQVNTALRRYLDKYRSAGPPFPTSLDLYAELRAVTPDSFQTLLSDLFEHVTLWEVRADGARVAPTDTGEYSVTLDVVGQKLRADSVGNETEVPMDDLIEIGLFAPGEGEGPGEQIYLQRHRIRSGAQTLTLTVPREPARAGIDPYHRLIDRMGDDNFVTVTAGSP